MKRIFYSLKKAFTYRSELQAFLNNPEHSCRSVFDISPELLKARNIQALALDFDGVLSAHAAKIPLTQMADWLHQLQNQWPYPIFILSNNPFPERKTYFKENFPGVRFITSMPRKPYPEGLLHIAALAGLEPHTILMVDDRLLTGILAAVLAGTQAIWINQPVRDFKLHFFKEVWFTFLRKADVMLLNLFKFF